MAEPTLEQRFALLETRVAELEHQRRIQEDRDVALLARVDNFTDDLRRIERVQLRGFEEQRAHQEYVTERFEAVENRLGGVENRIDGVENHLTARLDTVEDHLTKLTEITISHRQVLETLQAGQQQILDILKGKPRTND